MPESPVKDEVLAEVVRSGFIEGRHRGSLVVLDPQGSATLAVGDVTGPLLPRSCNKPMQAVGMLRAGLDLPAERGELLALATASHSGEPFHLSAVRRLLSTAGLHETDLANVKDYPLAPEFRDAAVRRGENPTRLAMNCSGKHAAMLATCRTAGWPTASYLDPEHPLQRAIAQTFTDLTGEAVAVTAVDGCGAPLLSTSLTGLARAFARLASANAGPEHRVAEAIRRHPKYVSGTTRFECDLVRAVPGLVVKGGAEACFAGALSDGRAFALKISDGGGRAVPVVVAALLRALGADTEPGVDTEVVRRTGEQPLLGGGEPVGSVRATLPDAGC